MGSAHNSMKEVTILHEYITSDHKPLAIRLDISQIATTESINGNNYTASPNWKTVSSENILKYKEERGRLANSICTDKKFMRCFDYNCKSNECRSSITTTIHELSQCLTNA